MRDRFDLNLLVTLDALLIEGSVTGAARRLNLSVPAVSRALGRLRKEFNDPLFVKAGRGLVPTRRATALGERVRHLLEESEAITVDDTPFVPGLHERQFRIVADDAVLAYLGGPLLSSIEIRAPHLRCAFLPEGTEVALRDASIDLVIGAVRPHDPEARYETVVIDRILGACRRDHPLVQAPITKDRYLEARHVASAMQGPSPTSIEEAFGFERVVVATAPTVSALALLCSTELVGTCYATLEAAQITRFGLVTFELPYELKPVPIYQAWHPRHDSEPAHGWLRSMVKAVVDDLALAKSAG